MCTIGSVLDLPETELAVLRSADLKRLRLGRYPFAAGIKYYIARRQMVFSSSTLIENEKKLRQIGRNLEDLKTRGIISTTDPRHMGRSDVEAYLIQIKNRGLKPSSRHKYIHILKGYLGFWGNRIMDDIKAQDGRITPLIPDEPIRALTQDELQRIFDATEEVPGHQGIVIRGFITLLFSTGIRPKEGIRAETKDLDMNLMKFYVRHPKGEETWGVSQWIPIIRGDMVDRLERYLTDRDTIVATHGDSKYLFFNPSTGKPYTLNAIRVMKGKVEEISGVRFQLKDFRSTLATLTIQGDLSRLKPISLQLRHSKLATTEQFYARIQKGEIEKAIGEVWKDSRID